jgi:hypothetical protein
MLGRSGVSRLRRHLRPPAPMRTASVHSTAPRANAIPHGPSRRPDVRCRRYQMSSCRPTIDDGQECWDGTARRFARGPFALEPREARQDRWRDCGAMVFGWSTFTGQSGRRARGKPRPCPRNPTSDPDLVRGPMPGAGRQRKNARPYFRLALIVVQSGGFAPPGPLTYTLSGSTDFRIRAPPVSALPAGDVAAVPADRSPARWTFPGHSPMAPACRCGIRRPLVETSRTPRGKVLGWNAGAISRILDRQSHAIVHANRPV